MAALPDGPDHGLQGQVGLEAELRPLQAEVQVHGGGPRPEPGHGGAEQAHRAWGG